jgi:hypothetical protein
VSLGLLVNCSMNCPCSESSRSCCDPDPCHFVCWSLKFQVIFDRAEAVHMSGMSEKAYIRSSNALQYSLGVKYAYHPCFADRCIKFLPLIIKLKFARVGRL